MAVNRHPGITMHNLPVGGELMGLVFAVGCAAIFLIGFPSLWYFVAFSAAMGIGVAILLRVVNRHRSERNKPLSILSAPAKPDNLIVLKPGKPWNLLQTSPRPFSA